jgi:hypothetical protein
VRTAKAASAPRLSQLRPGSISGDDRIRAESLRKATIEPVNVTAPMKTPIDTSAEWMPASAPSSGVPPSAAPSTER